MINLEINLTELEEDEIYTKFEKDFVFVYLYKEIVVKMTKQQFTEIISYFGTTDVRKNKQDL